MSGMPPPNVSASSMQKSGEMNDNPPKTLAEFKRKVFRQRELKKGDLRHAVEFPPEDQRSVIENIGYFFSDWAPNADMSEATCIDFFQFVLEKESITMNPEKKLSKIIKDYFGVFMQQYTKGNEIPPSTPHNDNFASSLPPTPAATKRVLPEELAMDIDENRKRSRSASKDVEKDSAPVIWKPRYDRLHTGSTHSPSSTGYNPNMYDEMLTIPKYILGLERAVTTLSAEYATLQAHVTDIRSNISLMTMSIKSLETLLHTQQNVSTAVIEAFSIGNRGMNPMSTMHDAPASTSTPVAMQGQSRSYNQQALDQPAHQASILSGNYGQHPHVPMNFDN